MRFSNIAHLMMILLLALGLTLGSLAPAVAADSDATQTVADEQIIDKDGDEDDLDEWDEEDEYGW